MKLNPGTGRITGALKKAGEFKVKLQAKNAIGSAGKTLRIVVGERIALTPPLGWNSWNCWGNQVDADKVLLSAPLLIGCDLEKLDDFTLGLLTNDEVLAVDHDSLGKSATCVSSNENLRVFAKDLDDGAKAAGLFNLGDEPATVTAGGTI